MGMYRFVDRCGTGLVAAGFVVMIFAPAVKAGVFINPSGQPVKVEQAATPPGAGAAPMTGVTSRTMASETGIINLNIMNAEATSLALAVGVTMSAQAQAENEQAPTPTLPELIGESESVDPFTYLDAVWSFDLPETDGEAPEAPDAPPVTLIPEPGTAALIVLSGLMALRRRR